MKPKSKPQNQKTIVKDNMDSMATKKVSSKVVKVVKKKSKKK